MVDDTKHDVEESELDNEIDGEFDDDPILYVAPRDDDTEPVEPVVWNSPPAAPVLVSPGPADDDGTRSPWPLVAVVALIAVALLVGSNVALWRKVSNVEDGVSETRARVTDARGTVGSRVADLESSVSDLESSVGDLEGSVGDLEGSVQAAAADLESQIAAVRARADAVVTCVNTYMDVIARWSPNVNSSYVYEQC